MFSPDGKMLASSSEDIDGVNNAYLWDADTGKCSRTFSRPTSIVNDVAFSLDGKTLASGGTPEEFVCLWDVNTGQQINTLSINDKEWRFRTWDVAFSPDGNTIATASFSVHLWQLSDVDMNHHHRMFRDEKYPSLYGYPSGVCDVAFSPDGHTIACSGFGEAHVWDMETEKLIRLLINEN